MSKYMNFKKPFVWIAVCVAFIISVSALSFMNVFSSGNEITTSSTGRDEIKHTISPESEWVGSEFKISYTFDTPEMLQVLNGRSLDTYSYVIWNAIIEETIPVGFIVPTILPEGFAFDVSSRKLTGRVTMACGKQSSGLTDGCKSFASTGAVKTISISLYATKIGEFKFDTGKYGYTFLAEHLGNATNHSRDLYLSPGLLAPMTITVKGANLIIPTFSTVFVKDDTTITATLDGELPDGAYLRWEVETPYILQRKTSTNTSLSVEATDVGKSVLRATYTYPSGFIGKSNDLLLTTKLPNISLNPVTNELWVYMNEEGDLIQQSTILTVNQVRDDGTETDNKFDTVWRTNSNDIEIYPDGGQTASVQAKFGGEGSVFVTGALEGYPSHSQTLPFLVKEYPQNISTPNVVLYMDDDPYTYPILFYPETTNVTGYTMTVLEGRGVVRVEEGALRLLKPGFARIEVSTEDVRSLFPNGDGPNQIVRKFYVQVRSGNNPPPETDLINGDFY